MAQGEYELAFYGKIVDGVSLEKVQANIALLFKASDEQVARMFTGKRIVIRNKLDDETALKYILAMKKRGALCQIEKMGQPGVVVDLSAVVSTPETVSSNKSTTEESAVVTASAPAQSRPNSTAAPTPTPIINRGRVKMANPNALPVAGEKVDDILANTHFKLDVTGIRLSEEAHVEAPELHAFDDVTLAPAGSTLVDKKEEIPVSVPDISHLSIKKD